MARMIECSPVLQSCKRASMSKRTVEAGLCLAFEAPGRFVRVEARANSICPSKRAGVRFPGLSMCCRRWEMACRTRGRRRVFKKGGEIYKCVRLAYFWFRFTSGQV